MTVTKTITLRAGLIKRLHVDQHEIRKNAKDGGDRPIITVQARGGPYKGHHAEWNGPTKLISPGPTLSCGAKVWIFTESEVQIFLREDEPKDLLPFCEI